jgi:hypothetical protein
MNNSLNITTPSSSSQPCTLSINCVDFTDTSVIMSIGVMIAITTFVWILSIVSKQLERRDNLSHFDVVFHAHHVDEDLEAQLDTINEDHQWNKNPNNGDSSPLIRTDDRSDDNNSSSLSQKESRTTSLSDCSCAKSFTVNMNSMLGSDLPDLPSVGDLCQFDIVIVNPKVKIMSLIQDADNYKLEEKMRAIAGEVHSSAAKPKEEEESMQVDRPRFLCSVDFETLAAQSPSYVSTLLHKGFDGIVVTGISAAFKKHCTEIAGGSVPTDALKITETKTWLDTHLAGVLEVTTSLQVPLIVEVDDSPISDFDLTLVNGMFLVF